MGAATLEPPAAGLRSRADGLPALGRLGWASKRLSALPTLLGPGERVEVAGRRRAACLPPSNALQRHCKMPDPLVCRRFLDSPAPP